ncbi:MAG: hypothetical protein J2P46_10495, partial [Zavarzinella sp.]|nr:hypothetical protein [Zavarzinella sp.]
MPDNAPTTPTTPTTPPTRGSLAFLTGPGGDLLNAAANVNLLRQLWLDRTLISGDDLGPGDPGDFDNGAWHSSCHLLGAGGVRKAADGRVLWLEVSHYGPRDEYYASVTAREKAGPRTVPLDSAEGRDLVEGSSLLGFVEGNSTGRTSARQVFDPPDRFNLWRRQDCDQPAASDLDGGKVWEHWCTLRDLRPSNRLALSVLTAYVSLVAALGDRFAATVARGRRDYGHPKQLAAMAHAGFVGPDAANWDVTPTAVPAAAEKLLLEADPARALEAVEKLDWAGGPRYYMFARKLASWSPAKAVKADLKAFAAAGRPAARPAP